MILNPEELLAEAFATSKEIRYHHEIFENLFSFKKQQPVEPGRLESLNRNLMISLFRDYYRRYLSMHLTPSLIKLLDSEDKQQRQKEWCQNFIEALKNVDDLIHHFSAFWTEFRLDSIILEQVLTEIKEAVIYDVFQKIDIDSHLLRYFKLVFRQFYRAICAEYETSEDTFRNNGTIQTVCSLLSESRDSDRQSHFFNISFVYMTIVSLYGNDEPFRKSLFNLLSAKISEFVDNFQIRKIHHNSINDHLVCFYTIFVQKFLEKVTLDVRDETRPLRSNRKEADLTSPGQTSHRGVKTNSFQKHTHKVNLEVIHTEDSAVSLALQAQGHGQQTGKEDNEPMRSAQKRKSRDGHSNSGFVATQLYQPLNSLLHLTFLKKAQQYLFPAISDLEANSEFIEDISKLLALTQASDQLIEDLNQQIHQRLIRNSNSTHSILKFYIDLLGLWDRLRLDCRALQRLITPLKAYLISRPDSLRVIITMLMEELNKKRYNHTRTSNREAGSVMEIEGQGDFSDDDASEDLNVELTAKTTQLAPVRYKKTDIKVLLADLYGSKERFFAEYESYVAEKLLYFEEVDIEDEQANINFLLDHLKVSNEHQKFGVIVSDLKRSAALNSGFTSRQRYRFEGFEFLVISEAFWPLRKEFECFGLTGLEAEFVQKEFCEYFKTTKKQAYVKFHNNLGFVDLDFELNGRLLTYKGPPVYGVLLMIFSEQKFYDKGIGFAEIQQRFDYEPEFIIQALNYWLNNGIMLEVRGEVAPDDEFALEPERMYFINKRYSGEKTVFLYTEKDNFIIQTEPDQRELNDKPIYFQLRLQKLILSIMNNRNGSCQRDHLLDLIKSIYKTDLQTNLIDQHFEVCLQKLVRRKALVKKGDVYYCP